ncbi:ABC transporter ATP-binding protein [Fusibacter ferrireducens]|uniref:ATP-binding cassette domain-containing protein n=1 Tax=Fusibacter ferrireducens TaxID=2785058 RepID=A0ABR9ZSH9_9FIRM|nr:ATP-binding cassette domain-containing protein [Fusibacter ferrireducens]MBF4692911.1 ATP-binding cassette domain-containing protein [Fusibacter ferrireducens]
MDIELTHLLKKYQNRVVVDIEKAVFKSGQICGIIGANGAGKTTLLKMIAGLEPYERGTICYDGKRLADADHRRITYLSQTPYMMQTSVYNNIAYPLKIRGFIKSQIENAVHAILEELQIEPLSDQLATQLSGGESQKVALARALVFNPEVLLLDEPTASIDQSTIKVIESTIAKRNREQSMTVITISHDLDQIERMCKEIFVMERGKNNVYSRGNHSER